MPTKRGVKPAPPAPPAFNRDQAYQFIREMEELGTKAKLLAEKNQKNILTLAQANLDLSQRITHVERDLILG